jgi:hypothetical protein
MIDWFNAFIFEKKYSAVRNSSAAMRNLADASSSRERLLNSKGLESLCYAIDTYSADGDLMLNIYMIWILHIR